MSHQKTLADLFNVTFSPESASGVTPSDSPDGPMTDLFGQVVALASLSLAPAPDLAPPTNATSGPTGSISSASAALQSSLESRLKQQLTTAGSTLFKLTWKVKTTPAGRSVCLLRASAPRTSDNDCGSWLTTTTSDGNGIRELDGTRSGGLNTQATLANWSTPKTTDANGAGNSTNRQGGMALHTQATLASWPTPITNDALGSTHCYGPKKPDGTRAKNFKLPGAANLASWPTPNAMEGGQTSRGGKRKGELLMGGLVGWPTLLRADGRGSAGTAKHKNSELPNAVRLVSGKPPIGFPAETEKPGQLNPAHSRWLMGLPPEWDACAPTATPSSRKSRKRS